MTRRFYSSAAVAFGAAALFSCSSKTNGELMLVIDTDMTAGTDFDRLYIEVTSASPNGYRNVLREFGQPSQVVSFPATFAIIGNGDAAARIHIRVSTGVGDKPTNVGAPKTDREVDTTVPADRVAMLRLSVNWLCYGEVKVNDTAAEPYADNICGREGLTCVAGECADVKVDSSKLPDYEEGSVFGGKPLRGGGACFDTLACFSTGAAEIVDMASCSIAKPAGGARINVAIATPFRGGGICGRDGCLVPLTSDAGPWGFRVAGDRVDLPRAVCTRIAQGRALAVVTTTACATKTESTPTCGPWSELGFDPASLDASGPSNVPRGDAATD